MIGQVAIQRKLLVLFYSFWKNNTVYIVGYNKVAPIETIEAKLDS